jgi:hypothetical protein
LSLLSKALYSALLEEAEYRHKNRGADDGSGDRRQECNMEVIEAFDESPAVE